MYEALTDMLKKEIDAKINTAVNDAVNAANDRNTGENLKALMETRHFSLEEAMDSLKISKEKRNVLIVESDLMKEWARGLMLEQINYLCDHHYYNDAICGYLMAAGKNAGLDHEEIRKLLKGLRLAFSEMSMEDAQMLYWEL